MKDLNANPEHPNWKRNTMEKQVFILKTMKLIFGICQNFSHVFIIAINSFSLAKSAIPNKEQRHVVNSWPRAQASATQLQVQQADMEDKMLEIGNMGPEPAIMKKDN